MGMKVLVVEDYEDSREFLKFLLEYYGCQVVEAANGFEALKAIEDAASRLDLDGHFDAGDGWPDGYQEDQRTRENTQTSNNRGDRARTLLLQESDRGWLQRPDRQTA